MKRLLLSVAVLIAVSMAPAQSIAFTYDFKAKASTPVTVLGESRLVNNLFDVKWLDVDALVLAGASFARGRAASGTVGGAIAIQPQISDHWYGVLGLCGRVESGRPIATGVLFGFGYRFRS